MQTATPSTNGRQIRKPVAPEVIEAAARQSAGIAKWIIRGFLFAGALANLAAAFGIGGTMGVLLALVAGGQATAAVLLSRE